MRAASLEAPSKVLRDVIRLWRICGCTVAARWVAAIVLTMRAVLRRKDLQSADALLGEGPFLIILPEHNAHFLVGGPNVISGIRELYCRDVYLRRGVLRIEPGDLVVDLGANMGNFTILALACGASRVVAVEPSTEMNERFARNLSLNKGFRGRVTLVRAFVGKESGKQAALRCDPRYADAPFISEYDVLEQVGSSIDFPKCDIEGAEFGLMTSDGLFSRARKIAVEVHAFAGSPSSFVGFLEQHGFVIHHRKLDCDGSATVLASRTR